MGKNTIAVWFRTLANIVFGGGIFITIMSGYNLSKIIWNFQPVRSVFTFIVVLCIGALLSFIATLVMRAVAEGLELLQTIAQNTSHIDTAQQDWYCTKCGQRNNYETNQCVDCHTEKRL